MDDAFDIRHYLDVLRRRWVLLVVPIVVISALTFAIAVILKPIYVSTARILVESQQIPEEFVRSSVTTLVDERIQVIEQRVMTRANVLEMVRKFDLQNADLAGYSSTQIVDYMQERTKVERVAVQSGRGRSGGVTIAFTVSFEHERPELATSIANELVTLILAEDVRTRTARAEDTTEFLEREAERLEHEVASIEDAVAKFKSEYHDALPERLVFRLNEVDTLNAKVAQIEAALQKTSEEIRLTQLQGSAGPLGAAVAPEQRQLAELEAQLVAMSVTHAENHPSRRLLQSKVDALKQKIEEGAAIVEPQPAAASDEGESGTPRSAAPRPAVLILQERRQTLEADKERVLARIAELQQLIAKTPEVERGLATLNRRLETTNAKLEDVWRKHADARMAERLEENKKGERFEVIEQPSVPTEPVRPDRKRILALGILLAFGVGGAGVVVSEVMDTSIRGAKDLAAKLGVRPLVEIPLFVSHEQIRLRRRRIMVLTAAALIACVVALVAIHIFFMPLDVVAAKIINRFRT